MLAVKLDPVPHLRDAKFKGDEFGAIVMNKVIEPYTWGERDHQKILVDNSLRAAGKV